MTGHEGLPSQEEGGGVWLQHQAMLPGQRQRGRHIGTFDEAVSDAVPLVGDLLDIGFKAKRANVALVRKHLAKAGGRP